MQALSYYLYNQYGLNVPTNDIYGLTCHRTRSQLLCSKMSFDEGTNRKLMLFLALIEMGIVYNLIIYVVVYRNIKIPDGFSLCYLILSILTAIQYSEKCQSYKMKDGKQRQKEDLTAWLKTEGALMCRNK